MKIFLFFVLGLANFNARKENFINLAHQYCVLEEQYNYLEQGDGGNLLVMFSSQTNFPTLSKLDKEFFWKFIRIYKRFYYTRKRVFMEHRQNENLFLHDAFIQYWVIEEYEHLWVFHQKFVYKELKSLSLFYNSLNTQEFGGNLLNPDFWEYSSNFFDETSRMGAKFSKVMAWKLRTFLILERYLLKDETMYQLLEHLGELNAQVQHVPLKVINDVIKLGKIE